MKDLTTMTTENLNKELSKTTTGIVRGRTEYFKALEKFSDHTPTYKRVDRWYTIVSILKERGEWESFCTTNGWDTNCTAWDCLA